MKAIPSLIASSTIGIAATGLVLGKEESSQVENVRSTGDAFNLNYNSLSLSPRPETSFTNFTNFDVVFDYDYPSVFSSESNKKLSSKSHRRPPLTHINKSKYTHLSKPSSLKIKDTNSCHEYPPDEEDKTRDSISSRGSWIRRLSSRPASHSQNGNIALDSQNESSGQTSLAQTSSWRENNPAPQHRNRLVKRAPRARTMSGSEAATTSGHKVPSARRPATSQYHFYFPSRQNEETVLTDHRIQNSLELSEGAPQVHRTWRFYFESQSSVGSKKTASEKQEEQHKPENPAGHKTAIMGETMIPSLIKPEMVERLRAPILSCENNQRHETSHSGDDEDEVKCDPFEYRPQSRDEITKRPRRSFSMQFVSPIAWLPRTGNIVGLRRNVRGKASNQHSSITTTDTKGRDSITAHSLTNKGTHAFEKPFCQRKTIVLNNSRSSSENITYNHKLINRTSPSPLPSLSRFSTLSLDLDRVGLSSSSSTPVLSENTNHASCNHLSACYDTSTAVRASVPATRQGLFEHSRLSATSVWKNMSVEIADRASTLVGSDFDMRGFTSCDEDDTDLQSETVYDSMRSGATGTTQSLKLPLEYMFDEAPSTVDHHFELNLLEKCEKFEHDRISLGRCKTMTDDVTFLTKDRTLLKNQHSFPPNSTKRIDFSDIFSESFSTACLKINDLEYTSLEDIDWNLEEKQAESYRNSNYSSKYRLTKMNYERLQNLPYGENQLEVHESYNYERPKTNVFDWSEPSPFEKIDDNGKFPRPRTAHVKQLMDGRNGRAMGRRGPSALHVRSQSVPVIPDPDVSKISSKFGTWGLSSKIISEDWDGDFEFESVDSEVLLGGDKSKEASGVFVPDAIKACQENIAGHVGQIREVCLLVEDLKRLRAQGKSRGLLDGEFQPLWLQADGIIALAAPAEEEDAAKSKQHGTSTAEPTQISPLSIQDYQYDSMKVKLSSDESSGHASRLSHSEESRVDEINSANLKISSQHSSSSLHHIHAKNSTEVARKVMESIHQQRSNSDPLLQNFAEGTDSKMPFDTTSLKDLVNRAAALSRTLNQVIRVADGLTLSTETQPSDSSPAFIRVFTDPKISPPKSLCQKNSSNFDKVNLSSLQAPSQTRHMMAVG